MVHSDSYGGGYRTPCTTTELDVNVIFSEGFLAKSSVFCGGVFRKIDGLLIRNCYCAERIFGKPKFHAAVSFKDVALPNASMERNSSSSVSGQS